jgi:hypothetical protein
MKWQEKEEKGDRFIVEKASPVNLVDGLQAPLFCTLNL